MTKMDKALAKIPALLASKASIVIYVLLFAYLVVYALLCLLVPALRGMAPPDEVQLIMGNYTNVLSALGASIAAGAGVAAHSSMKAMHQKHDALQHTIEALHAKLDRLEGKEP